MSCPAMDNNSQRALPREGKEVKLRNKQWASTRSGQAHASRSTSTRLERTRPALARAYPLLASGASSMPGLISEFLEAIEPGQIHEGTSAFQAQARAEPGHSQGAITPGAINARGCPMQEAISLKAQSHARGRKSQIAKKAMGQHTHWESS